MSARPAGTTRRARHVERRLLPASARTTEGLRRARVLRRAFRYRRGELDVLRAAARGGQPRLGGADAAGLRVLHQAVSEVHAPRMFEERVAKSPGEAEDRRAVDMLAAPNRPTSTSSAAGSSRWRRRASWARCSRSFRRASRTRRTSRDAISAAAAGASRLSGRGRTAAPELERPRRRDARPPQRLRRGLGADRRAEVPILDPPELPAERAGFYYMRLHGRNAAQWWRHDKSEDRYNYLYSADELQEFADTADAARRHREEAVSLHQQPLLRQVGRQRGDDQAAARRTRRRASTRRSSWSITLSSLEPCRHVRAFLNCGGAPPCRRRGSLVRRRDASRPSACRYIRRSRRRLEPTRHVLAARSRGRTTAYWPSRSRPAGERDVDLAVGERGQAGMGDADGACDVRPLRC